MMDLDPAQLRALAAAVSEGTFDAAARTLHVTPSAVSQRVKALETSVGRVLLTRTKPVRPTPSGETLLRLARQIQAVTDDVARELGDDEPAAGPRVVPLAVNADSLSTWFLPALASLGGSLVFDLHRSDQDRTADLLRQGSVMAAVTASEEPVPGCSLEKLGRMRYRPMASPAFAERWFAGGATAAELAHAPVVVFDRDDRLQEAYLRRRSRRGLQPPRHFVPGSTDFFEAVRLGLGWGMLPDLQTEHAVEGEFVDLDPRGHLDVALYWQQWKLRSASLDAVTAAVRDAAATALR
ncbi:LysR family transcriptional regulator ArgP [Prauserella cavernicola]|uniref:HTH-type transcriptional regulator LysG n=1 Tax=Prauserella cavernicola TaxID=2800127 RepID=A0A934V7T2_9PSEU|nr:LysR family transcriptional regulator ArgP [Prauserella cavernicola]MBK1787048.1 LysR family transcriptional regulator ArgP [Prauserella cavernicola]